MTAEIIKMFEDEQGYAQCPECDGIEFYVKMDDEAHMEGLECSNCGWDRGIIQVEEDDDDPGFEITFVGIVDGDDEQSDTDI